MTVSSVDQEPTWLGAGDGDESTWSRLGRAARVLPSRRGRPVAAVATLALVAATWAAVEVSGGRDPEWADLVFLPAVVAGLYFGVPGGVVAGTLGAIALAPFTMPGHDLGTTRWLVDSGIAVCLGGVTGGRAFVIDDARARSRALTTQLLTTYRRTLHLIAEAIELRDPLTAGHSRRVAHNARTLGAAIGIDAPGLASLYWAGLLHDVGKVAVPEAVLQKPGELSDDEWGLVRRHPGLGAALVLKASTDFAGLAEAVGAHHECWDGSGYPDGIAGEDIPLTARILSVVDVFEALTSARPYRQPLEAEEAMSWVSRHAGTQFDPAIVSVFERLFADGAVVVAPFDPGLLADGTGVVAPFGPELVAPW